MIALSAHKDSDSVPSDASEDTDTPEAPARDFLDEPEPTDIEDEEPYDDVFDDEDEYGDEEEVSHCCLPWLCEHKVVRGR